jgi:cyclic beta-1,2-glucan synthetase
VRRDDALIQLLDPPFDKSPLDPGYIRGYVPGVRENGGQYTHGASGRRWPLPPGRQRARLGIVEHDQPGEPRSIGGGVDTYKAEPYVIAADVYALAAYRPRWLELVHRLGRLDVPADSGIAARPASGRGTTEPAPCLPADWPEFKIHYRYLEQGEKMIVLVDAQVEHLVEVMVGL